MSDLLAEIAGPPRDRWGRYKLPQPDHPDQLVAYTRATTVAKAPEDQGGLMKWAQRMVVIGLGRRQDLHALAATTDPDDKKALGQIARDAEEAGGSATGRNTGTAIHAAIEAVNRGDEPLPLFADEVKAYREALAAAGLTPDTSLVERIVANTEHLIAGTFDIGLRDADGNLYVGDLKTGSVGYPASMAIQLAIYATADQLVTRDYQSFEPPPEWSTERGIIIHLPPGGPCTLHWIDLEAGARGLEVALAVRGWRKDATGKRLLSEISTAPGTASGAADAGVETAPESPPVSASRLDWFRARYTEIRTAGIEPKTIAARWPEGCPRPNQADTWTPEQLEAACAVVQRLHDDAGLPFPPRDPGIPVPARPAKLRRKPKATKTLATPTDCTDLRAAFDALDPDPRTAVLTWQSEGFDASRPWTAPSQKVTRWHWATNAAAVGIARHADGDIETARGWIALVIGDDDSAEHPIGALIGSLSTSEAEQLVELTSHPTFAAALAAAA